MNVVKATRQFEGWLGRRTDLVTRDLCLKHAKMKEALFPFFRATFYRWAQLWPKVCPDLAKAPHVLAVGDLHVENFGTWRDAEGRLIWGVNDFDESYPISYANDLVRMAVSAHLAVEAGHLALKGKSICDTILDGYTCGLREKGQPYVLDEQHTWLRLIAESDLRDPIRFWARMNALPTIRTEVPLSAIEGIEHLMPARDISYRMVRRIAGLGSLGHARFVAIASWRGGPIAREAKALVPSSCHWAQDRKGSAEIFYQTIISRAVRCPDPFVQLRGRWIVRRLAPHCSRIELATIRPAAAELRLLHAMGWETANVHLATRGARKTILRHSAKQKGKWIHEATDAMLKTLRTDWQTWQKQGYV